MALIDKIFKEKLDGYESPLPVGAFSEFQKMRDSEPCGNIGHTKAVVWIAVPVFAAVIACMLIFPEKHLEPEQGSESLLATVLETNDNRTDIIVTEKLMAEQGSREVAVANTISNSTANKNPAPKPDSDSAPKPDSDPAPAGSDVNSDLNPGPNPDYESNIAQNQKTGPDTPYMMTSALNEKHSFALAGGSALVAGTLFSNLLVAPGTRYDSLPAASNGHSSPEEAPDCVHYFPFRCGVSIRFPLNDRLSLVSGLNYSIYRSASDNGTKQKVHYIGVPARLDYSFLRGRIIDLYAGAGASLDFCVAAHNNAGKINNGDIAMSFLVAGGFQFNFNERFGMFVEPQLDWNLPLGQSNFRTYRTEHQFMFSIPFGLRYTLPID